MKQEKERCCEEDFGGSHWHCANCGKVSSMYGHSKQDGTWYCEEEDVKNYRETMSGLTKIN